jgi:undecaprenyl-diphosphatase
VVGTLASVAVGLVAIKALLGYVRRHDYTIFAVYRVALAIVILILIATNARGSTF